MERNRISPGNPKIACRASGAQPSQECPILCITKSVIFVLIAVFILYLPLGDPNEHCSNVNVKVNCGTVCNLCEMHNFLSRIAQKIVYVGDVIGCVILDGLYEAKLRFYSVLERIDRNDLCRSVCCAGGPDDDPSDSREKRRAPCRCIKRKCRK